jgi:hypothetical protein
MSYELLNKILTPQRVLDIWEHEKEEELFRNQIRKAIIKATKSIDYTETILTNPEYKIIDRKPIWQNKSSYQND